VASSQGVRGATQVPAKANAHRAVRRAPTQTIKRLDEGKPQSSTLSGGGTPDLYRFTVADVNRSHDVTITITAANDGYADVFVTNNGRSRFAHAGWGWLARTAGRLTRAGRAGTAVPSENNYQWAAGTQGRGALTIPAEEMDCVAGFNCTFFVAVYAPEAGVSVRFHPRALGGQRRLGADLVTWAGWRAATRSCGPARAPSRSLARARRSRSGQQSPSRPRRADEAAAGARARGLGAQLRRGYQLRRQCAQAASRRAGSATLWKWCLTAAVCAQPVNVMVELYSGSAQLFVSNVEPAEGEAPSSLWCAPRAARRFPR
jgi:hypothetical protein